MFDFDGTLADSGAWFLVTINQLADEFGFDRLTPERELELRNCEALEVMRRLRTPLWKLPRIMKRVRELAARDAEKIPVFAGVEDALGKLRAAGILISMVSSNSEENIRRILGENVCRHVNQFHCGASLMGKASKLRRAIKAAGVSASEALYVGDEIRDASAARDAGVAFGAVSWGYTPVETLRLHNPAVVFASIAAISEELAR